MVTKIQTCISCLALLNLSKLEKVNSSMTTKSSLMESIYERSMSFLMHWPLSSEVSLKNCTRTAVAFLIQKSRVQ